MAGQTWGARKGALWSEGTAGVTPLSWTRLGEAIAALTGVCVRGHPLDVTAGFPEPGKAWFMLF